MKVIVVGSGKLANVILASDFSIPSCEMIRWDDQCQELNEKTIVIHAGSGRQLQQCLAFCTRSESILIELSTGLETERIDPGFPLIVCPNTSILMVKVLIMLKKFGAKFEEYKISIIESHQSTKTTEPGTAYNFAESLKAPYDGIVSIRDPEVQKGDIGIPVEFLGKHAYHKISIRDDQDEVTIETKVLGHDSYARGVKAIVKACINYQFEKKKYTVLDLIDHGML